MDSEAKFVLWFMVILFLGFALIGVLAHFFP